MMNSILHFIVDEDFEEFRIDKYLSELNSEYSRSFIQKLIKDGLVKVNGKEVKAGFRLSEGDEVSLSIPDPKPLDVVPENIPLDIVYEDEDVVIVNKPKGMVVHPAPGHLSGTLVNALLFHCKDNLSGINGVLRPGIVHRIDKDTSGLLVICKNDNAHRCIAEQLKEHSGTRVYYAIVHGTFKEPTGHIDASIRRSPSDRKKMAVVPAGKNAITDYKVIETFDKYSLVECRLKTGRTHQIRVHMAHIGHPLVGDPVYSGYDDSRLVNDGQVLHAAVLGFKHPTTGENVEFSSELPDGFQKLLNRFRKNA